MDNDEAIKRQGVIFLAAAISRKNNRCVVLPRTIMNFYNFENTNKSFDTPLICKGCSEIIPFSVLEIKAILESELFLNPTYTCNYECKHCNTLNIYTIRSIFDLIDPIHLPKPLDSNMFWALILGRMGGADNKHYLFGERVLLTKIKDEKEFWYAGRISNSQFVDEFNESNLIIGKTYGNYHECMFYFENDDMKPLGISEMKPNSEFGIYIISETGDGDIIEQCNLYCSNPSCSFHFPYTYNQFKNEFWSDAQNNAMILGGDTKPYFIGRCRFCKTCRVINEMAFEGIKKI